jgi:hypothetical protein
MPVCHGPNKINQHEWLQGISIRRGVLLSEPWILHIDTTMKPLYRHQEGAVVS